MKAFVANKTFNHAMVGAVKEGQLVVVADDYPFLNSLTSEEALTPQILSTEDDADLALAWDDARQGSSVALLDYSKFFEGEPFENILLEEQTEPVTEATTDLSGTVQEQQPASDLLGVAPIFNTMIGTEPAATEPAATEPAATEPAATEPAATEPVAEQPADQTPLAPEADMPQPVIDQPTQPVIEQPVLQPEVEQPVIEQPKAAKPRTSKA